MGDFTLVNNAAMSSGIDSLARAQRQLRDHLDSLEGQLKASLAQWDGSGQAAYREAKSKWDASATRMENVVQKMTTVLGQISENYSANETNIASRWAGGH